LNIRILNEVMLLKHLHKFYNREDLPRVKLIWENYYRDGKLRWK
jgi:hypothetical protein